MIKLKTFTVLPDTVTEDTLMKDNCFYLPKNFQLCNFSFISIHLHGSKHGHSITLSENTHTHTHTHTQRNGPIYVTKTAWLYVCTHFLYLSLSCSEV